MENLLMEYLFSYAVFSQSRVLRTGNMKKIYLIICFFFGFLTTIYTEESEKPGCLDKDKSIDLLEIAESLLEKAKDSFPSCQKDANSTACGKGKSFTYMEITKKLIFEARENIPTCTKSVAGDEKPKDCLELLEIGHNKSGVYTIWPRELFKIRKPMQVYCDMETDNGGWTVIQRRGKFPVQQDFYQDWETYKNGFGSLKLEFWLGNENIRVLCHKGCEIRFDLQDDEGQKRFALYKIFKVSGDNYTLSISGFSGDTNDSMQYGNGKDFSTKDRGDTKNATYHKGGWWYGNKYYYTNLNGVYEPGQYNDYNVGWFGFRVKLNLASVEMKVKPK